MDTPDEWGLPDDADLDLSLGDPWSAPLDPWNDGPCDVCECCPCNLPGCPVCNVPSETGRHGVSGAHAIVTRSAARARRVAYCRDFGKMKRRAQRLHRRAWARWTRAGDYDAAAPSPRSLTGWEVA